MLIKNFRIGIEDSKFKFKSDTHRNLFISFVSQFEGQDIILTVEELTKKRSLSQNDYYWFYLRLVSKETGNRAELLHNWVKGKFLTKEIVNVFGDDVRDTISTTKLNKSEFQELLLKLEEKTGVPLPDTSEYYGSSYHK